MSTATTFEFDPSFDVHASHQPPSMYLDDTLNSLRVLGRGQDIYLSERKQAAHVLTISPFKELAVIHAIEDPEIRTGLCQMIPGMPANMRGDMAVLGMTAQGLAGNVEVVDALHTLYGHDTARFNEDFQKHASDLHQSKVANPESARHGFKASAGKCLEELASMDNGWREMTSGLSVKAEELLELQHAKLGSGASKATVLQQPQESYQVKTWGQYFGTA